MAAQQQPLDAFNTEHLHADLKGRTVRGGVLTVSSQGAQHVILTVATVVLARLLTPADFGLVAMVTAITGLGQAFADLGLSEATIQQPSITHQQVSTLFWVNVGIGATLMLITAALAPILAWFYRDPRVTDVTLVLSITFLIGGLRVQHDALLKRQMRFFSVAIRDVGASVAGVFVGIALAWRGEGYWALVFFSLTTNLTGMMLTLALANWMPGLPRRDPKVRSLIGFGGNVAASYLINTVIFNADNVLVGWYLGAGPLGLYSRAYNLLTRPATLIRIPVGAVAIPAFSRVQEDPERLARYYLRTVNLIMWMSAPIFGFLFVAALPLIVLVLGNRWQEAAPVFQILAICSLGQMLFGSTGWLFVSCGQSRRLLKMTLILTPIIVGSYAIGLPFGIKGVALSGSVVLLASLPWIMISSFRGTNLNLKRLGQAIVCPVSACLVSVGLAELTIHLIAPRSICLQLLVAALGCTTGYLLSLLIPQVRREVALLKSLIGMFRSGSSPGLVESVV